MESNSSKNSENDFSYLVGMALRNRMPWNILAFTFNSLPLTLNEAKEIIGILLKELEALQSTLQKKSSNKLRMKALVEWNTLFQVLELINMIVFFTRTKNYMVKGDISII